MRRASAKDSEGACLSGSRNGKELRWWEWSQQGEEKETRSEKERVGQTVRTQRQFCVNGDGKSLEHFEWSDLIYV